MLFRSASSRLRPRGDCSRIKGERASLPIPFPLSLVSENDGPTWSCSPPPRCSSPVTFRWLPGSGAAPFRSHSSCRIRSRVESGFVALWRAIGLAGVSPAGRRLRRVVIVTCPSLSLSLTCRAYLAGSNPRARVGVALLGRPGSGSACCVLDLARVPLCPFFFIPFHSIRKVHECFGLKWHN